ncbi:PadR family transcriptional regulator [Nocardia aurantiaca]|uniref:PadR family transcriptional regulator n=1 Tax=Nocardia aurantiaca TaxID=2675850 RepID=A0A6I3L5I7_9NOCA|nr:PadR family transcriptional regulator [Nocardia aurantiaca]MTE15914.1 PadR family transcriptional regulator [Nocardia aurantiaca]
MARKRKVANLMGLAVLSAVVVEPMHRYEIAARLRAWGKDNDMGVKWGSLYTVVDNLAKHGFLEVAGSERDGARPERTIYRITDAGRAELTDWTRELLSDPEPEKRRFVAGLSVASVLPPEEVTDLLTQRISKLDKTIAETRAQLAALEGTVPHLFLVEEDYELTMLAAEATWARALRDSLADGSFPGVEGWRAWHREGVMPAEIAELAEGGAHTPQTQHD